MNKQLKIILVVVAVLVVLSAGAFLLVKSYLTEERLRALVVENAEKSLNRQVSLGAVNLSLFKGIVVRDLEIKEKDARSAFLKTREFAVSYRLLPLLSKRLVIDRISLIDPTVRVTKNPDGTFNFSDMAKAAPEKERKETAAGLPLSLNVERISVENARLTYADAAGGALSKADLLLNAELGISASSEKALSSEGGLKLAALSAVLKDGKTFKDLRTEATYKIDLNLESGQVTIHSVDANVVGIPVQLRGSVDYAPEAAYALDATMPNIEFAKIRRDLLAALLPPGSAPGGSAAVRIKAVKKPGKDSSMSFNGNVRLNKVSLLYKGINPVVDGTVKITPDVITLDGIRLIEGQNSADIVGNVKNYLKYPDVTLAVKSRSLALDRLLAPAAASRPAAPAKPEGARKEPEPLKLKMRVNATADIDRSLYKGIAITDFRSRFELKDNVFRIIALNGNTLSGAFALKGAVDLAQRGMRYNLSSDLKGIRLEELVNAFAPKAKGKLFGILSGKADVSGAGTLPANVKRNLKGKGAFAIKDGSIRNAELSAGLLAILGLQELREIPIRTAEGSFTVGSGIVNLKSAMAAEDLKIDQTGTIGLDEKIDLGILVQVSDRLAPKLVSQSGIARFLSSRKGWTGVPLRVGGTLSKPSYNIDTRAVGKKTAEGVQKRLGEELLKRLPQAPSREGEQAPGAQPKKTPGDLLKDLFRK